MGIDFVQASLRDTVASTVSIHIDEYKADVAACVEVRTKAASDGLSNLEHRVGFVIIVRRGHPAAGGTATP